MIETLSQLKLKPYIENKGHSDSVTSLVISPDQKYIVSASQDKTIKVRDFKNGELLKTLIGNTDPIISLSMSKDEIGRAHV